MSCGLLKAGGTKPAAMELSITSAVFKTCAFFFFSLGLGIEYVFPIMLYSFDGFRFFSFCIFLGVEEKYLQLSWLAGDCIHTFRNRFSWLWFESLANS